MRLTRSLLMNLNRISPFLRNLASKWKESICKRNLFPNHSDSFQTNPKKVLNFVWWKTVKNQSDAIQGIEIRTKFSIRINPSSDWFGLKTWFRLVQIHLAWCPGLNLINLNWFLTVFHQPRCKAFFGFIQNDAEWFRNRFRNGSE